MPSHSVKQAKVMSAISHGWKPTGSVAKIPVKVAKEFHAADAGHKYGKKHTAGGAIKSALNTVRKYGRKAEGGEVDDTPPDFNALKKIYISPHKEVAPPISTDYDLPVQPQPKANKSPAIDYLVYLPRMEDFRKSLAEQARTSAELYKSGQEGLSSGNPLETVAGAGREIAGTALPAVAPIGAAYEALTKAAGRIGPGMEHAADVAGMVNPDTAFLGAGKAALFALPALKAGKKAAGLEQALDYAAKYGKTGVDQPDIKVAENITIAKLKDNFNHDIAIKAVEGGFTPEQIANIKTYMSPGSQKGFDNYYSKFAKFAPKKEPSFAPALWNTPEIQATKPSEIAKQLEEDAAFHAGQREQEPFQPHNEDEFHTEPLSGQKIFKPTGKDSDIEDFYKHQEEHANKEWQPDETGPRPPTNDLHVALSPHDLEEKSAKLGLNTTAFHGTKKNFSEFKLPEEMDRTPEIGVHFGTLRAAVDRGLHGLHPLQRQTIENNLKSNTGVLRESLSLRPHTDITGNTSEFRVIPSRIGTNNPLTLPDLGTWSPASMRSGMLNSPAFTKDEVNQAYFEGIKPGTTLVDQHVADTQRIKNLRKLIESKGYDSIAYRNSVEDPGSLSYIIWNLNKARSFYAKFDPAKAHSRNLGAGIAGLSLVPLGLYQGSEQPERKAEGGKVKEKDPEEHEFIDFKRGGLIDSDIPGRTDKIPMKVSPGSYVLPADIPSALGQGNTKAGSDVLGKMFTHAAYGLKPMTQKAQPFRFYGHGFHKFAEGGETDHVPIVAAGGEFIIHPDVVKEVGHGDIAKGHQVLDKFVLHTRAQHIKTLRKLKPPKP